MDNTCNTSLCGAVLAALLACTPAAAANPDADLQAGINAFHDGDLITAMERYQSAADAGSPEAQARLAWIYDQSEENDTAVALYRRSAEQAFADGEFGLGEMYAKGEGVEQDIDEAFLWFERAAHQGHLHAIRVLINAFERGALGREIDQETADKWRRELEELASSAVPVDDQ
jgi:TPR repeat protein